MAGMEEEEGHGRSGGGGRTWQVWRRRKDMAGLEDEDGNGSSWHKNWCTYFIAIVQILMK